MTVLAVSTPTTGAARYTLRIADGPAEVRAAQRLRYEVFAEELGARLHTGTPHLDVDEFDRHCDHLIVVEDLTGAVVGTYRMLPPGRIEGRYSDTEFELSAQAGIAHDLVETGRSCVRPDHRGGAVINLMWAGIARYMHLTGHQWLAGCASVGLDDGGTVATGVWDLVQRRHLAPEEYRVTPRQPWHPGTEAPGRVAVPPLLRGYLRLGAWVCGAPAYDPDFGCADFYVLLGLDRVDPRYLRHFLGAMP
ncbi:GNAT family N-acetyltransferase [Rugosimonospora acidiphila]|uniref:GNAT family N-acetyltransferase n=1 Tax=Rugosimonospora acidiphila TaxID=556531 RepID=A0ABP9SHZ7_9ACTN